MGDEAAVEEALERAFLGPIVRREGGIHARQPWPERLSGGEQQRIGFARLFYHRPQFAFLDECTSNISIDVEDQLFERAQELGATLVSISHRPATAKHHVDTLVFDGEGAAELQTLG